MITLVKDLPFRRAYDECGRMSIRQERYAHALEQPHYPVPTIRYEVDIHFEEVCIWSSDPFDPEDRVIFYDIVKSWDRGEEHSFT